MRWYQRLTTALTLTLGLFFSTETRQQDLIMAENVIEKKTVCYVFSGRTESIGYTGDNYRTMRRIESMYSTMIDVKFVEEIRDPDRDYNKAKTFIRDGGCDLVFGTSSSFTPAWQRLVREFPQTYFVFPLNEGGPNYSSLDANLYDIGYVYAGVMAQLSRSQKIGIILYSNSIPASLTSVIGFYQSGSTFPGTIQMYVGFTGLTNSTAEGIRLINAMHERGVDTVLVVLDQLDSAVYAARSGMKVFTYSGLPNSGYFVSSFRHRFDLAHSKIVEDYLFRMMRPNYMMSLQNRWAEIDSPRIPPALLGTFQLSVDRQRSVNNIFPTGPIMGKRGPILPAGKTMTYQEYMRLRDIPVGMIVVE